MDFDLAIVGGGPAGVATALFLAAAAPHLRDRIAILEKDAYPRDKICAGAIGARADRALEEIGVRVACPSVPVRGLSVAAGGRSLAVRTGGEAIGRVVRRIEFDAAFAEIARGRGIRIETGARVTGLEVHAGGVRLESSLGDVRAKAVVGADGVGSFVRRALRLPRGRLRAQVIEADTPATATDATSGLHFDLLDRSLPGYAWDFPTVVDGEALVCRGLYALEPDAVGDGAARAGDLLELFEARLAKLGVLEGTRRRKRFSECGLALHDPIARPRALLVGEAAGIDPVLGEGIAQAILYGRLAGPYLARRLESGELGFGDWRRELASSRLGLDLAIRTRALRFVYGRTRAVMERWITSSADLARSGMDYFAGRRVSRRALGRAAIDLAGAVLRGP